MTEAAPTATAAPVDDPYVGLANFTEADAEWFFGREAESAVVVGNLRAARLTLLYAESGVGKSSVLRAGVVASLRDHGEREGAARGAPRLLPVIFSTWSGNAIGGLIDAIAAAAEPHWPDGAVPELGGEDLEAALRTVGEGLDTTPLLILDQFEEHFLYPDEAEEGKRVADQIAACVNDPSLRANFLISIREDAYSHVGDLFRGKIANVYGNFLHLDFLDRQGAREAIERPIAHVNELDPEAEPFSVEPELVEAVLAQVGRDDDGDGVARVETTYLQLVMRRLWEVEMGAGSRVLRLRALEELGGAQAIIGGHLDRAMDDSVDGAGGLTQQQRLLAASAFHFLVTSGGTKIALSAQDLADLTGIAKVELEPVLRHLSSPKLHILRPISPRGGSGEPLYEIFHDALARPIVEWRGRVEDAERDARLRREREKKEEAQREAQEAERRAASERRRKRIALVLLGVAVAALVLGAIAFGIEQQDSAEENRDEAQSVEVSQRLADLSTSPTFGSAAAALASLEAYRLSPTFQARIDTLSALQLNPALPTIAVGHTRTVFGVTYWPGSTNLASGSGDGTVRLWDSRGQEIGKPLVAFPSPVLGVAVSPTGGGVRTLAASNAGGAVRTWDLDSAGRVSAPALLPAKRSGDPVVALGFDPVAASVLAVGRESGRVELWRFSARRRPHRVGSREAPGPVTGLAFGGGDALAVSSLGGTRVWPLARGRFAPTAPKRVPGATRALSVAMTAGGRIAVGGEAEAAVFSADMRPLMRMPMTSPANAVGLAASGSVLVVGSADSTITTWEVDSGRPFGPPRVEGRSAVISLAVGPGGRSFASAGGDNLVKAWALYPRHALANTVGGLDPAEAGLELDPGVRAAAVGAGDLVAAATGEAGTSVWRLDPGRPSRSAPQPLFRIPGFSEAVAYRGSTLAVQQGRSFVLYDTGPTCATMPREPCRLGAPADPHSSGAVTALALARYDGKLVVVSSGFRQGTAVIDVWDASDVAATGEVSFLATRSTRTPGAEIHGLAVGPPSTPLLAAAASDGKVRVWELGDPSDPRGIGVKSAHGNENQAVDAVAFSPDGSLLASAGGDQQVVLWEVEASDGGYTVEPTPGTLYQSQSILSLAFSPDGETLAAGDGTGSICLYDVESRQVIGRRSCLPGHRLFSPHAGVWTLAFAHQQGGGRWLLSGGKGQQLLAWNSILWDLDDDQGTDRALQDDVCALAGRDLTRVEWTAAFSSAPRVGPWHRVCSE